MDVFVSWSGKRSGAAAEALRDWLPKIINALKPWLSAADIDKGARWGSEIATKLKECKAGIICLTPENLHSDWLLFEAGAISKAIENTYVCPFLIGLEPADVGQPLAQFQATRATKDEVLALVKSLNGALTQAALPESHINEAFEVWWPKLESKLRTLPVDENAPPRETERELRDMVVELLALVRNLNRQADAELETKAVASDDLRRRRSIANAVRRVDAKAEGVQIKRVHGAFECHVLDRGRSPGYKFLVPDDVEDSMVLNSVEALVTDLARDE